METIEQRLEMALEDFLKADGYIKELVHTHKELLWKPDPKKWSAAQCIEHLIVSNTLYFPILEAKLAVLAGKENNKNPYKPTFWGRFFYKTVDPATMGKRKTTTPKIFRPQPDVDIPTLITRFERTQNQLLVYAKKTLETDASKKIQSPASPIIRYSLVDTMAILSKHELRHHQQALNVLKLRG